MQIGIDIGTHVARAAYLDEQGQPRMVRLAGGIEELPALARQTMHGLEIGLDAADALAGNGETTVVGCTRLLGRPSDLPPAILARLPYSVRESNGEAICNLLYAEVRAAEIYGRLARALVDAAERDCGTAVEEVILTIPAAAEDRFRVQARAAVEAQGVRVRRLINQPAAALLAARLPAEVERVAVVNCGGGSTDVSIAHCAGMQVRILATAGDMWLGGDDFAWSVAGELNRRFCTVAGVDVFQIDDGRLAAMGLRRAAEDALRMLSSEPKASLVLDHGGGFGRDLATVVTRFQAEDWLAPLMARIARLCMQAMTSAHVMAPQIDAVLMIGDWAFLPVLQETVAAAFGRSVAELHCSDPARLPVMGAALASNLSGHLVWDVTPYALGISCYYGDEELFSPIIRANTPIPTPAVGEPGALTESYHTRYPDQTEVTLEVLQYRGHRNPDPHGPGRVCPHECEALGNWLFEGLHPKRGERVAFTVTFSVDADGILQLVAQETATGHSLAAQVDRGIG